MVEKKAAVVVLKNFFGLKQDQTLKEFNDELKQLTPEDKMWMAREAAKQLGCEVVESTSVAA